MEINSIALVLIMGIRAGAKAQVFRNLDFRKKCDSSKTGFCHLDLSWGAKESARPAFKDKRNVMSIEGKSEKAVTFVEQEIAVAGFSGINILSLSAMIKSENVIGKGAGLNIGLYDAAGTLLASKDMGGFYSIDWIKGSGNWKKHVISVVCPPETRKVKIGLILFGKGRVWYAQLGVKNTQTEGSKPSKLAADYLAAVCDTIKKHSLLRDSLDITSMKGNAMQIAGQARKYSDCFLAVNYLLESLRPYGDHHSFFMSAGEVNNWKNEGSQVSKIEFPSCTLIDSCGYILVPPFHGGNQKQILAYADSLQRGIEKLSKSGIKGWIVDLRNNTGGNMEPMIAGLGPLFSAEKLGALIDVNGQPSAWYYKDGRYYGDDYKGWSVSKPFRLMSRLPLAVLTSGQTGSSGEVVTISFIGNANTRSFGKPTWGLTTGNGSFDLKDGSQIFLASTIMSDRNGKKYTVAIDPDITIEDNPATASDETISEALKWINELDRNGKVR